MSFSGHMHLNVYIAKSGFCSRRKAALFIKDGKVELNGKLVREPWLEVKEKDTVRINGKGLHPNKDILLIFNKPRGVTSTLKDKFASKKITDFIPKKFGRIYPVGRLDKNSRGLIILTNNGTLCYKLTHPKFEVEKEYLLWVSGRVTNEALERLKEGIKEGKDILKVKSASIVASKTNRTNMKVVVCEGKKRHLRRLFRSLGFRVLDLKRIRIDGLRLGNLKEGNFRVIDPQNRFFEHKHR